MMSAFAPASDLNQNDGSGPDLAKRRRLRIADHSDDCVQWFLVCGRDKNGATRLAPVGMIVSNSTYDFAKDKDGGCPGF